MRARTVGAVACRALERSKGWVTALPDWQDAPYADAAGELVWLGRSPRTHHPRMVTLDSAVPLRAPVRIDLSCAVMWRPAAVVIADAQRWRLRLQSLCDRLEEHSPRGLGALLAGMPLPFPLDLGVHRVRELAQAYAEGSDDSIAAASSALLGFGTGLTPAGDDLVGGALFGANLLGRDTQAVCARILAEAAVRTHRLSCALLGDLAGGQTYGALHELVEAVERDGPAGQALSTLGAIGHSSGWDMFTGLVIGAGVFGRRAA